MNARHYFRCPCCLTVVTSEGRHDLKGVACVCGHDAFEFMGRVVGSVMLTPAGSQAPCDARCTNAPGPSCDCKCRGQNHGSQRVVEIDRVSKVPQVRNVVTSKALANASEWRAALVSARKQLLDLSVQWELYCRGEKSTITGPGVALIHRVREYNLERGIRKAIAGRTHTGRMKALRNAGWNENA